MFYYFSYSLYWTTLIVAPLEFCTVSLSLSLSLSLSPLSLPLSLPSTAEVFWVVVAWRSLLVVVLGRWNWRAMSKVSTTPWLGRTCPHPWGRSFPTGRKPRIPSLRAPPRRTVWVRPPLSPVGANDPISQWSLYTLQIDHFSVVWGSAVMSHHWCTLHSLWAIYFQYRWWTCYLQSKEFKAASMHHPLCGE